MPRLRRQQPASPPSVSSVKVSSQLQRWQAKRGDPSYLPKPHRKSRDRAAAGIQFPCNCSPRLTRASHHPFSPNAYNFGHTESWTTNQLIILCMPILHPMTRKFPIGTFPVGSSSIGPQGVVGLVSVNKPLGQTGKRSTKLCSRKGNKLHLSASFFMERLGSHSPSSPYRSPW